MSDSRLTARRNLLQFLLASPLLANTAVFDALAQANGATNAGKADLAGMLDVFDFETVARQNLPPAHWGYLATGVDAEATIAANRAGFGKFQLRSRRLVDVSKIDTGIELFGVKWGSPIILSPVSSLQAFHPDGEIGAAKAAKAGNHLQMVSTLMSYPIEKIIEARGTNIWFQLYPTDQFEVTSGLLRRANAAGCPVAAVTVDLNGGSNRETFVRSRLADSRDCTVCHKADPMSNGRLQHKEMFKGIDTTKVTTVSPRALTWDSVKRMRDVWPNKLLIKGLVTKEDAELALRHGLDGVIVSNHGGRADESGRSTIECVSEVVAGVKKKIPVIVDSGFRRGTDIFKALALGATAVGVGRPYVWGLAAYGQQGAEAVLQILRNELATVMRQSATLSIKDISGSSIIAV